MLIVNTQPTFPPTGAGPYLIDRTWCLGDSLPYLNGNTNIFTNSINSLQTTIAATSGNLLSLINTLSSNMNQYINVPYARLAELPGQDTAVSNLRDITGSTSTNTSQPAQLIFPISTAVTLTRNLTLVSTPANYIDTIGITKNGDRSIRFPTTGTYEIFVESPVLSLHNTSAWASVDIRLIDGSSNVIIAGTPISLDLTTPNGSKATLRGRFSVTNTSTNYFIQIRRNQGGQSYGLCAAVPSSSGGVLFTTEIWKLS